LEYPHNVRIIRLMCSGAIDPVYIIDALLTGADGVLIGGCHTGNCHYQNGNYKAQRRVDILRNILHQVGFAEDRVWVRWISASEGQLFASTIREMVKELKAKEPNPLRYPWAVWQGSNPGP
jgi:F420-non-reducing hydrogenase iron-sulfur subunit